MLRGRRKTTCVDISDIQRVFRHVPGRLLVLLPDTDFTIVAASEQYLQASLTDAAIFGRPLFEVFPDDPAGGVSSGSAALKASLLQVIDTGAPHTMDVLRYDIRLPQAEGGGFQERYWLSANAPVLGADGQVQYIVHSTEDATAKANRAVQVLESITEGFYTLDRQWRFDYANHEAHRVLHRQPGGLQGKVLWEEFPGLAGTEFERCYRRVMAQREKCAFTEFYPDYGRWYDVTASPAPEGISVYFRDVTDRKNAQAERERLTAESENQRRIYETVLDSTPDFVYVFDLDHRAMYANQALKITWGVEDVRGKTWMELGYEQWHADMHDRELEQVISTRAPIRGEVPFTGTNGRRIYDYIFAPVLGRDDEVVAVAGTTRDVTERKAGEEAQRGQAERLAEADRAKDEFLATLSHELRNPLAPLRNSIELLRMIGGADHESASIHAMMARQVDHLVRLVDDLLEMSSISRGSLSLRRERVELAAIVRHAVETSEPLIRAGSHALQVELPADPLWLEGDQVRLAQILGNLLNNAARYTEDGGRITVQARRDDGHVLISVRDTGVGMAPDALPRMFEMFSRGDRDSTRSQGGLGIGLALSRRLAQMHNGSLEASSDGIGHGSQFDLRLPLGLTPPDRNPALLPDRGSLAQIRVLVVDDNHDAGDSLGQVLEVLGADVLVVRDGPHALEAFASYQPSVVLLDIGMPAMNGYEVARSIRARFPDRAVTLVAVTGWGQEDDRRRAREAGFDHHLLKPAEIGALQQLLALLESVEAQ